MQSIGLSDVSKRYGDVAAVDHISFDVKPGELLTILGPSGCGKTTTMRLIAGLERADTGQIQIGERVVSDGARGVYVAPEQRQVGMVFQSYAIWPHMTVFQNVAYPLTVRGLGRAEIQSKVTEALALVDLAGYETRPATNLSGGQQQRVALARAIVFRPSVLLLDEPLSNLDAKLRAHMRFELKRLQQQTGITTVYVTHDQTESMALSDRIIVMRAGHIEQVGRPRDLYERPRTEFVADFIGSANRLSGLVQDSVPGTVRLAVAEAGGDLVAALVDGARPAAGTTMLALVRPERVHVEAATGQAGPGRWLGHVEIAIYYGDRSEFQIRVGELVLHAMGASDHDLVKGAAVDVTIAPQDVILLPQDDPGAPA